MFLLRLTCDVGGLTRSPGILTPTSTASISPGTSAVHTRSVKFGPLSPTSTRTLARVHQSAAGSSANVENETDAHATEHDSQDDSDTDFYRKQRRRRRHRRNSDPSSDRPRQASRHRRSHSRGSSPDVEVLPDRFDRDGRPIERDADGGEQEMVEKLTRDFGDVVAGKKSFKDLLLGVVSDFGSTGSLEGGEASRRAERPRRRRHKERER